MIECEECEEWFHLKCMGLTQTPEKNELWYCRKLYSLIIPLTIVVIPSFSLGADISQGPQITEGTPCFGAPKVKYH